MEKEKPQIEFAKTKNSSNLDTKTNSCETVTSGKYKVVVNGKAIYATQEEAQKLIDEHMQRNHYFSIDEMWKVRSTIYLNDRC